MRMPKTLVVATDFSDCATSALAHALLWAHKLGGDVDLLHVVETCDTYGHHPLTATARDYFATLEKAAGQKLVALAAGDTHVRVRRVVSATSAAPTIMMHVRGVNAGMVFLGTAGRADLPRGMMGGVASQVTQMSPVPVFTVGRDSAQQAAPTGYRRILLATDFSEVARSAAALAAGIVARFGAALVALHVLEAPHGAPAPAHADEVARSLRGWLGEMGAAAQTVHMMTGIPEEKILEVADEEHAELVVMGSLGVHKVNRVLVGSVAERVVRGARCPVLVAK